MLNGIETIFDNKEMMMKHLKKKGYIENMEQFRNEHGHFFTEMITYVENADEKENACKEVADDFSGKIKQRYLNRFGKVSGKVQADLNLFTVLYVFPAILLLENPLGEKLCDALCSSWAETFPGNKIGYTTYEKLLPKFREKIFGIF